MLPNQNLRQIGGDKRFAFFGQRAGNQHFFQGLLLAQLVKLGAQRTKFLRAIALLFRVEEKHGLLVGIPVAWRTARQQRVEGKWTGKGRHPRTDWWLKIRRKG